MRVTMDMFSGRPNPSWLLTAGESDRLVEQAAAAPAAVAGLPPALGFRGFIVETELRDRARLPGLPQRFSVASPQPVPKAAAPARPKGRARTLPAPAPAIPAPADDGRAALTDFLLRTAERAVPADLIETARQAPAGDSPDRTRLARSAAHPASAAPLLDGAGCVPLLTPMNPSFWEYVPVRLNNNCYNYATNFASNTVAQPGRRSGRQYGAFDCDEVRAAALRDGCLDACVSSVRVVALAIWPGVDFHWYRLHPGGFWAHKLGITDVLTRDNLGRLIGDGLTPETCDRGPYTIFCGFFYAPLGIQVL